MYMYLHVGYICKLNDLHVSLSHLHLKDISSTSPMMSFINRFHYIPMSDGVVVASLMIC